jgi:gamma-glutamylcyclotransferase (GGCT)/AIG2-like uncharacterized protein YtfP
MGAEPTALFVYGTLKRGQLNSPLLAPYARAVEPARTRGQLYDLGLYPALVAGEGTVHGELVRLDAADLAGVLTLLDRLEGYRPGAPATSMYLRRVIDARAASGASERAHAYFYNRDHAALPRIAGGEWPGPSGEAFRGDDTEREAFERHVRSFRRRLDAPRS